MITCKTEFRRLKHSDKVEQAVRALHEYIIHGKLRPGTELPPESEMAKQLGVSKFSMREALRVAQAQGLVEIIQGRRTKVAEVSTEPATGIMNLIFRRSDTALLELTEVRQCLECNVVRFAALRVQPEQIDAMRDTIRTMQEHQHDMEFCIDKDVEFHTILLKASHNKVFEIMLAPLTELLKQSRSETLTVSGIQRAIDEHTVILEALIHRSPDKAVDAMRRHLHTTEENLRASGHFSLEP